MLTIQPQYLSLSKLLGGRLFQIPEYQRAYSWTSRERGDLFSDIERTYSKGSDEDHFMAAVVCLRRKKQVLGTDEFFILDVVDGQQRLTTLIILLKAIMLELDGKDGAEVKLATELSELLVKPEGDEPLLLQTNQDKRHYFADFLKKGDAPPSATAKTLADRELLKAIEECQAFVARWQSRGETLSALALLLKNHLFFLFHEVDDEKLVYSVFEVLNSRGLDVSWFDRLKSILMGEAFELKNANQIGIITGLHDIWSNIYSVIGLRQGLSTEALRFAATLYTDQSPNRPMGEEDSVALLRSKNINDVASWLLRVTEACDAVLADTRINAVTRISQARLLATAITLRQDIKPADRKMLLRRWEKVSFRIYGMLGNDARVRVGDYVRLAWRVIKEELPVKDIDSAIGDIGEEFPIEDAIDDGLREENCYEGWESELRYFMYRYEEYLSKKQHMNFSNEQWIKIWIASPSDSIEHIWAQSKAPRKHRHRLGNLVMLPPGLNSKLQDKRPEEKSAAYRDTGLLIAREVADLIDSGGWNRKILGEREDGLLAWAAT
jgi:hypothetical protein